MLNKTTVSWLLGVLGLLVLVLLPALLPSYMVFQASVILTYAMAILGLNLLMGFNGQVSLAQGVFFAIGAYAVAILAGDYFVPFWIAVPIAIVLTAILGAIVGVPALRLQGVQLAIVTLVLAAVFPSLLIRFDSLTKGTSGIPVFSPEVPGWLPVDLDTFLYLICLSGAGLCVLVMLPLIRGEPGRRLRAVRDNAMIAEAFGINIARTRISAFAMSAAFAGFGGGLYAIVNGYVSPDSFGLFKSFEFVVGAILGGITSVAGAFVGALIVVLAPEIASKINQAASGVVYGLTLIVMMIVARHGVIGLVANAMSSITRRHVKSAIPATKAKLQASSSASQAEVGNTDLYCKEERSQNAQGGENDDKVHE